MPRVNDVDCDFICLNWYQGNLHEKKYNINLGDKNL